MAMRVFIRALFDKFMNVVINAKPFSFPPGNEAGLHSPNFFVFFESDLKYLFNRLTTHRKMD